MSTSTPTQDAPSQTSILFARGVIARLAYWPALRIAVDQLWGGPDSASKRTWLASVLVDDFEEASDTPDADYVEDRLLQVMADEFDAVLEDGSAEEVAKDVVRLWAEVSQGRDALVTEFEERADKLKGKKETAPQLLERPPKEEPEVDEDGFTTVKGKGKSHR
ncbi:Pre-rRNA-processing protein TSR2-domain-containing protein [Cerioporus squamosus]|nr:Pre-rRNA-processing protein TSR2-domain-containing protein [Cerioporus squamosus]